MSYRKSKETSPTDPASDSHDYYNVPTRAHGDVSTNNEATYESVNPQPIGPEVTYQSLQAAEANAE